MDISADNKPDPVWHDIVMHMAGIGELDACRVLSSTSAELTAGFRSSYSVGLFSESVIGCKLTGVYESIVMRPLYVKRVEANENGDIQCVVDTYVVLGRSRKSTRTGSSMLDLGESRARHPMVRIIKLVSREDITEKARGFKNTTIEHGSKPKNDQLINCGKIDTIFDIFYTGWVYNTCVVTRQSIISDYLRQDTFNNALARAKCFGDIYITPVNNGITFYVDDVMRIMIRRAQYIPNMNGTKPTRYENKEEITAVFANMSLDKFPSAETYEFVIKAKKLIPLLLE